MSSKRFQNELGNSIEIEASEKDIDGVSGIHLFLTGPTSDTELHITRLEAQVLHEELGRSLGKE